MNGAQGRHLGAAYSAGWRDVDVLQLLRLFRAHTLDYLYGGNERFAAIARAKGLNDKTEADIVDRVRVLMSQFALAIDTKAFHNDALSVDGETVMVHVHLFETTSGLAENAVGGMWHPDELRRFFEKIHNKFYALRELYEQEKKAGRVIARSEVEETRFRVLEGLFRDVSPQPRKKVPAAFAKRPQLWSPDELDTMIQLLVQITLDVQQTGTSDAIEKMAPALGRSEQSYMNKLIDMHKNYKNKSSYPRAAHLPDTIFDASSVAHKIFNADPTDSYAVGFSALKAHSLRVREKKRRAAGSAPYSTVTRKQRHTPSHSTAAPRKNPPPAPPRVVPKRSATTTAVSRASGSALPQQRCTAFIRDMAQTNKWSDQRTHDVCAAMHQCLHLYRSNQLKAFVNAVVEATSGLTTSEICFQGIAVLKAFQKKYGSLDSFGEHALGIVKSAPGASRGSDTAPESYSRGAPLSFRNSEVVEEEGDVVEAEVADGNEDDGAEDPVVSPSDLASSPLLIMSDFENEHDESSGDDENPIDGDDDDVDTLSMDSVDNGSSPPSFGFETRRRGYPSGQSYGKSDEIMKKVKAACESCHAKKKSTKKSPKKRGAATSKQKPKDWNDSDDDDENDSDDEEQQAKNQLTGQWNLLLQSLDARIVELENRNRDLIERKEDRERREQRKHWRNGRQIELLSLYREPPATNS
ncbi:hypothetical protein PybrP1_003459 [[Pythium] brassicae (nom. inval.)]|nr:hypothetical protein PybrP1_003459 [[Pythium] brassicae (nom. inval.)]